MLLQSTTQMKWSNPDSNKAAGIHWSEELKFVWLFVEIIDQPKLWGMCLVKSLAFTIIIMKVYYCIVYYVSPILHCWSFLQIVHKGHSMITTSMIAQNKFIWPLGSHLVTNTCGLCFCSYCNGKSWPYFRLLRRLLNPPTIFKLTACSRARISETESLWQRQST